MNYKKIGTRHAHRVIAERKIGRPLRPGEVVHHIDGDHLNNASENLEVLPSQAEHARLHTAGAKRTPKAVCKKGHPLTGDNVKITSKGLRRCATCERQYDRDWKRAKRLARGLRKPGPKPGTVARERDGHGRFVREVIV